MALSNRPGRRFGYIPRRFSGTIRKDRFAKEVLGDFFGGSVRGSLNPLKRKDVREVLDRAGVLGKLDPTADGPRSKHVTRLTEKEAVEILEATRKAMRENLQERSYGIREEGKFRGRDEEAIYRKTIEQHYKEEMGKATTVEEESALHKKRARRKQLMEEQLASPLRKRLTGEPEDRRTGLLQRLGLQRDRTDEQGAQNIGATKKQASIGTGQLHTMPIHPPSADRASFSKGDTSSSAEPEEHAASATPQLRTNVDDADEGEAATRATDALEEDDDTTAGEEPSDDSEIEKNLPL